MKGWVHANMHFMSEHGLDAWLVQLGMLEAAAIMRGCTMPVHAIAVHASLSGEIQESALDLACMLCSRSSSA